MPIFPTVLDDFTPKEDSVDNVMADDVNELQTAIEALEAKVGIDASEDPDSLDYKISHIDLSALLASAGTGTTLPDPATNSGKYYYLTTTDTLYRSNGSAWIAIN